MEANTHVHRDDVASKLGMWLFIFTEILLFGGMFIVYSIFRYNHPVAFHLAGEELNDTMGLINTIILLVSSMTVAMSITAMQRGQVRRSMQLLVITIILGLAFLVNKYFEWGAKFDHHIYPGSSFLRELGTGDTLFFGLYFMMTGLHALHIIVGLIILVWVAFYIQKKRTRPDKYVFLENGGLYWHLVDLIWIFLFPLFYLIH
ncbi:MAG TPA: cytochrome c oxidase subunit 3 family protein [Bacteroidales bacterium]|nr:cytochrome c oxidase subunit 3 family protein [Bacteroidales bacterium]HSA44839.1 cytochrome c oxidase subunit 3 family protein [Bacteroidales bacterium]